MSLCWLFGILLALPILAQGPDSTVPLQAAPHVNWNTLAEAAVPADSLEPVAAGAQLISTPDERAQAIRLLYRARYLSNFRLAGPYDLKTTFTSTGDSPYDGTWQLEDTSPDNGLYRWTAQSGSYSAVNLYNNRVLYSNQPGGTLPLRLAQVRAAIFFVYLGPAYIQSSTIRSAGGNVDGKPVTCILFSDSLGAASRKGRSWEESEYCVDPGSGLLMSYSPVPGVHVFYDYSSPLHLADRIVPGKFTIAEGGNAVVEAHLQSLTDPGNVNRELFTPDSSMTAVGSGSIMTEPWRMSRFVMSPSASASAIEPVIVHGIVNSQGRLSEAEIVETSNSGLNEKALALARSRNFGDRTAPGATPQQHEIFFTLKFVKAAVPGS